MTTITITKTSITVEGHAEYAEKGQDIVCAAVSAITCALMEWVRVNDNLTPHSDVVQRDGYVRVFFSNPWAWEDVREFAVMGYRMIADAYPDHVKIVYGQQS